jgi:hypothetical protein
MMKGESVLVIAGSQEKSESKCRERLSSGPSRKNDKKGQSFPNKGMV